MVQFNRRLRNTSVKTVWASICMHLHSVRLGAPAQGGEEHGPLPQRDGEAAPEDVEEGRRGKYARAGVRSGKRGKLDGMEGSEYGQCLGGQLFRRRLRRLGF